MTRFPFFFAAFLFFLCGYFAFKYGNLKGPGFVKLHTYIGDKNVGPIAGVVLLALGVLVLIVGLSR